MVGIAYFHSVKRSYSYTSELSIVNSQLTVIHVIHTSYAFKQKCLFALATIASPYLSIPLQCIINVYHANILNFTLPQVSVLYIFILLQSTRVNKTHEFNCFFRVLQFQANFLTCLSVSYQLLVYIYEFCSNCYAFWLNNHTIQISKTYILQLFLVMHVHCIILFFHTYCDHGLVT